MKELVIVAGGIEHTVWVGRNARDNWRIIQDANEDDIWFHLEAAPSCHVILKNNNNIDPGVLRICASICKGHTEKFREKKMVITVLATNVANLRLGKTPGLVHILNGSEIHKIRV